MKIIMMKISINCENEDENNYKLFKYVIKFNREVIIIDNIYQF